MEIVAVLFMIIAKKYVEYFLQHLTKKTPSYMIFSGADLSVKDLGVDIY